MFIIGPPVSQTSGLESYHAQRYTERTVKVIDLKSWRVLQRGPEKPDIRSCRNCAHRDRGPFGWTCIRAGHDYISVALSQYGVCGPHLRLWAPRPPWWRRWFFGA